MRKGACNCIFQIAAWVMLCLICLSLSGCTRGNTQSTVICNNDENSSYLEVISKALPSYTVTIEKRNHTMFSSLNAGNEVEVFNVQAMPALESGVATHWYPHYLATVIIAVDRDRTDARIDGWNDLPAAGEAIGYLDHYPDRHLLMGAIAYGLEGEDFTLKKAADLLETLHVENRLALKAFDAPIVICYDYQVASLIKNGRNMEIVLPNEGTLTYQKGLLSNMEIFFSGDVESLLLSGGFRLMDGRCDDALYANAADYKRAAVVTDYDRLNTAFQDVPRVFRRDVQHIHLYTSADGREHQLFALVYMALIHVNSPWFDEIRFRLNSSTIEIEPPAGRVWMQGGADVGRRSVEYRECEALGEEIKQALTQVRQQVRESVAAANAPKVAQTCPLCGATTTPDASGRCEYCGGAMQG